MNRISFRKISLRYRVILLIIVFIISVSGIIFAAYRGGDGGDTTNNSSPYSTHSSSGKDNSDVGTQKPKESLNNGSTSKKSNSSEYERGMAEARATQAEADRLKEVAKELQKCIDAEKAVYETYLTTRDAASLDYQNRTKNIYNDPNLDINQKNSVVNYFRSVSNQKGLAAYNVYASYVSQQGCTPVAKPPSGYPLVPDAADLMTNYPHLSNYPY